MLRVSHKKMGPWYTFRRMVGFVSYSCRRSNPRDSIWYPKAPGADGRHHVDYGRCEGCLCQNLCCQCDGVLVWLFFSHQRNNPNWLFTSYYFFWFKDWIPQKMTAMKFHALKAADVRFIFNWQDALRCCFIWFIGWILCYNISHQLQYTGGRCCWPLVSPAQTIRITLTPHRSAEAKTRNDLMLQKPTRKMHPPSWLKTPDPNVPCWTPIKLASFLDVCKGKSACT